MARKRVKRSKKPKRVKMINMKMRTKRKRVVKKR